MTERVDVAILGGGCAGLSLAVRLAEAPGALRRVVVLEARESYARDRTWCGWSLRPHPFSRLVSHSWRSWEVRWRGEVVTGSAAGLPYEHLRADDVYASALERIGASDAVRTEVGVEVGALEAAEDGHLVRTSRGDVRARVVVDTRPGSAALEPGGLVQSFFGCEAVDPYDSGAATLMDFDVPHTPTLTAGEVAFVYRLPLGDGRALVEATSFAPVRVPDGVHRARLGGYLDERGVARVGEFEESGAIPMAETRQGPRGAAGLVRTGIAGGAAKPSSGYAFHAIQRTADALADALRRGETPDRAPAPRSGLDAWLDRVFIRFLQDQPERAPDAFMRMFARVDGAALVRFLMEEPRVGDRLQVVRAMPKAPLTRAALRRRTA